MKHTLAVLWCRMTFRHKGEVHFTMRTGPYWICDHCGDVLRP